VFEAARAVARHVLKALSGSDVRVGLLGFADDTRVRAYLGSPERALEALASIPFPPEPRATNLERAIRTGQSVLRAEDDDAREKILLILSDGHATRPGSPFLAGHAAMRAARSAARSRVLIHAVAIGPYAADGSSAYAKLAALTKGAYFASRVDLARIRGEAVHVEINNATTGDSGRAIRLHSDGAFDAFVPLVPGANRLSIQVVALDGTRRETQRTVNFEPTREITRADLALAESLHRRTREIELAGLETGRPMERKLLEVEIAP